MNTFLNPNEEQVMVDLETLSTNSNAVITEIGLVKFSLSLGIIEAIEISVDPFQQILDARHLSADTVRWWRTQLRWKEMIANNNVVDTYGAAMTARAFIDERPVWGNGSDFDNVILCNFLKRYGQTPWNHRQNRCYRTVKSLCPSPRAPKRDDSTVHSAYHDAVHQTRHLIELLNG